MALIFNLAHAEPSIHAFIIGIGAYPYLVGGANPKNQILDGVSKIDQLISPPLSSMGFYNTLIDLNQSGNLSFPLGSVEFFASEIPGSNLIPAELQSDEPNRLNIANAFDAWVNRCESNSKNLAVFYFCGHGIQDGDHYLLTSDFGQRPNYPFEGSFNFDQTMMALNQLKIDHQIFFVDACRYILPGMLKAPHTVQPLLFPNRLKKDSEFCAVYKGAAANNGAFAIPNQVSFFTKAIINGLNGAASKLTNGRWVVSTSNLADNLESLMNIEKDIDGDMLRSDKYYSKSFPLTTWNDPTNRTVILTCDPDHALPVANLHCIDVDGVINHTRGPENEKWKFETPAGFYRINATFPGGYNTMNRNINVEKPINEETIWCNVI